MTLVLVVDDSKFMRTVLGSTLQDYGYSVIEASDGKEAVEAVRTYDPDVVTMDVVMPEMDGLEATEKIMETHPVPILMLSAHTEEGTDIALESMKKGAVDFVSKPEGKESPITAVEFGDEFVDKVDAVSQADVGEKSTNHLEMPGQGEITEPSPTPATEQVSDDEHPKIVIGASTGGPSLVEELLKDIPRDLDAYIFVVQHMPEGFTQRYAQRLDRMCEYDVVEAQDGLEVKPGTAVVAKGGANMIVRNRRNGLAVETSETPESGTSSIDATLESVAERCSAPIVATLLTGMGDDGSRGIEAIKEVGGYVIAQDEETSPVFGIPKRAIQTGNVDEVLSDYELVNGIVEGINKSASHG